MLDAHAVLMSICKTEPEKYLLGFYFWLDLVATVSLILDIPEANMGASPQEAIVLDGIPQKCEVF